MASPPRKQYTALEPAKDRRAVTHELCHTRRKLPRRPTTLDSRPSLALLLGPTWTRSFLHLPYSKVLLLARKYFQSILVILFNSILQKCFHAFEITPNSWFSAGNISFQSIFVIFNLILQIGKFKKKVVVMEKLTQLLSAQKRFHVFEIPPNSWFCRPHRFSDGMDLREAARAA